MGNNNQRLKGNLHNSRRNYGYNNYKNAEKEEVNSDDEKNNENNLKISEYDKELSQMLFNEENKEEENNKKKSNKKIGLKEEMQSYAEQIEEEKFMEEINKSKSVVKNMNKYINENEAGEYAEFKKGKENMKKKRTKKEEKEKNEKDKNITNIKTIKGKNNVNNINKTNTYTNNHNNYEEKKRVTSPDKLNNKIYNNLNVEQNNNKKDTNTVIMSKGKEESLKQIMKNYYTENVLKNNNINNNNIPENKNVIYLNNYQHNHKNNQVQYYRNNNNLAILQANQCRTAVFPKRRQENNKKSEENPIVKNDTQIPPSNTFEEDKNIISRNVYGKIKKENIKIVTLYLKNGNNKYDQGLQLCGLRNYKDALTSFAHSKNSYMQLRKLMSKNTRIYPEEFRKIINDKLTEKISLVNQSIKECNNFLKKGQNRLVTKNSRVNEILKKVSFEEDNDINLEFSHIDDSFDFNSPEPEQNPIFRGKKPTQNQNNQNNQNNKNNPKSIHQEEESQMDAKIESEIMQTNPGVKFSDIIGMEEMKKILYEVIVVPSIRPDLFTGILKPQRGILLFGPPGTGKTMIAKAIATECKSTFFSISASSLTSKWVGESEKTVKSLFKLAYKKAPSIIFIDEIDSILSKRNESENEATKRLKTEFLIQFDGLGSNNKAQLLVIAATNRPMDLDEALLRRLPKRVYCGPLDVNGRFIFIKKVINKVETNLSDQDIMEIAKLTKGYSNSDLKELCKEAAFQPVRELTMEQILHIQKFRPLVKNDLLKAVNKIRGTMSNKIIDELIKWNEQFGGV